MKLPRATFLQRFRARGELGRVGEQLATRHLKRVGYRIIGRNIRMASGELDIVAWQKPETLIIAEVRTRATGSPTPPELTVRRDKQQRLICAAAELQLRKGLQRSYVRFDIIAIEIDRDWQVTRFDHFERAFEPPRG